MALPDIAGDWWERNAPPPSTLADMTSPLTRDPQDFPQVIAPPEATLPSYQALFQQLTSGVPPTPQQLEALAPQLRQHGIEVLRNAAGVAGKIRLPTGQVVDVIAGAMQGGSGWQWLTDTMPAGGPSATLAGLQSPYAGVFTGDGAYPLASVMGQGFLRPWTTPFQAPTDVTQQTDPGWQFRMREGLKALERSAAAKGSLLTGGTLKALNAWAQDYASNEYDKVYNRALQQYQQAYDIYGNNANTQWSRLGTLAAPGLSAAGSLANLASGYAQTLANLYGQQGNARAMGQATSGDIWGGLWPQLGQIAARTVPAWWPQGTLPITRDFSTLALPSPTVTPYDPWGGT